MHLAAIYEKVGALAATGDLTRARDLARNALSVGSSGESRALLERLAALDYQAGSANAAREHYEAAANNFDAPPTASPSEQAATLNSLGALYLLRGDLPSAEKSLNQAASRTAIHPDLRAQIFNNLGVLAEMRGDLVTARDDYSRAYAQRASTRERNVAQANLSRLKRP
jgi:tetratricopeptide (TPR) repeat protein